MNLQLPLIGEWFEMTKKGIKKEDYREITPHWCSRLLNINEGGKLDWRSFFDCEIEPEKLVLVGFANKYLVPKSFKKNIMTLGYPRADNTERILKLGHEGIEVRTGNPDWGAEPDKLYFVIKHGKIL